MNNNKERLPIISGHLVQQIQTFCDTLLNATAASELHPRVVYILIALWTQKYSRRMTRQESSYAIKF